MKSHGHLRQVSEMDDFPSHEAAAQVAAYQKHFEGTVLVPRWRWEGQMEAVDGTWTLSPLPRRLLHSQQERSLDPPSLASRAAQYTSLGDPGVHTDCSAHPRSTLQGR